MADPKPQVKPPPSQVVAPALRPAGESSDPNVHYLLGQIETERISGTPEAMQVHIAALAALGYSAS